MSSAGLDRLLAVLILGLAITGGVSLTAGAPGSAALFLAHDLLAGLLALAVVAKLRGSLPRAIRTRRWRRLAVALVVTALAAGSLGAGYWWVIGGSVTWLDLGPLRWTPMTIHAALGIALLPLLVVHLVPRRWRVLRVQAAVPAVGGRAAGGDLVRRRAVLRAGAYSAFSVAVVGGAGLLDRLAGGTRRFTGSRFLPSGPPGVPTTFLGEPQPVIDAASWRLHVAGRVDRAVAFTVDELEAIGRRDTTAVLDCTSGWAIEGTWTGVPLADVLDVAGAAADAGRVDIVAVTGWRATLTPSDARRCLLAWSEGGAALTAEHGAPVRLVAPDHRGLEWVKWVDRIEVA